eukprot:NODE_3970_length_856_cov_14.441140_g3294_i0.p1 GENE.NODE_3970_length_856_cov_14.441140_g3294_i0~~NODE_3970_length_856_cov_14.441140_g3294_i0.p1  ORF type:complete len:180 (+),score=21.04 NODE_3970_length_856_cov_14.441140_g3294_i0:275-814(+)
MAEERGGLITRGRADDWAAGGGVDFGSGQTPEQASGQRQRQVDVQRWDGSVRTVDLLDRNKVPLSHCSTAHLLVTGTRSNGKPLDADQGSAASPVKEYTQYSEMKAEKARHHGQDPADKFVAPQTSSQQYGWYAKKPIQVDSVFGGTVTLGSTKQSTHYYGKQGSDVTHGVAHTAPSFR